jgi:uncharacterized protein YjiS (DUF1127 family)
MRDHALITATLSGTGRATMAAVSGWWRRRRAMRRLSALDDYILRDMGLTRGSIDGAVRRGRN